MSSPSKALFVPKGSEVRKKVANVRLNDEQTVAAVALMKDSGCKTMAQLLLVALGFAMREKKRFVSHALEVLPVPIPPEQVDVA